MADGKEHLTKLPPAVRSVMAARTGDAVFVVGPDLCIAYWDPQSESLTGVLSEEAVGKPCYEVVQGESEGGNPFCTHNCSVMHLCQAGHPVSSYDMRISTHSGEKRWVNVSILSVDSDEGPYMVHLMRDSQGAHQTLEMAHGLIRLSSKKDAPAPSSRIDVPELTARQLEVLRLLSYGRSAREIGQELYLSQATIRNHIRSLLQALGAHSQLEALAKAREIGLL